MNKIPFVIVGLLLSALTLFSVFGFLASFELDAAAALPWKIGYATIFFSCLIGLAGCVKKITRTKSPRPSSQ